ncbi:MAG: hypothetical protein HRU20_26115 [Pseudomonadales bacterium]|nr:hypothetical protein [Pseudomonadales bacterium]
MYSLKFLLGKKPFQVTKSPVVGLFTLLLLAACQQYSDDPSAGGLQHISPVYPEPDEIHEHSRKTFQVRVHDGVTDDMVLVINGKDFVVAGHEDINVSGNQIYGTMQSIRGALVLGDNSFGVRSEEADFFESYAFFYDDHNPRLYITSIFNKPGTVCYLDADEVEVEVEATAIAAAKENTYFCDKHRSIAPIDGSAAIVEGEFVDPSPIASFTIDGLAEDIIYFHEDENGNVERQGSAEGANRFQLTLLSYGNKRKVAYSLKDELNQQTDQTLVLPGNASGSVASVQLNVDFTDNARPLINELIKGIFLVAENNKAINVPNPVTVPTFDSNEDVLGHPVESAIANTDASAPIDANWLPDYKQILPEGDLGFKGTFACPEFWDFKVVPTNGQSPIGCGFQISSKPQLISPTVDFGFWKHDADNAMQAYFDVNLKKVAFDIEMYTYTDTGFKLVNTGTVASPNWVNIPVLLYAGGYKARVTLENVTLRSVVTLSKSSGQFVNLGAPSDFTLRYTNVIEQKLADWLTDSTVVPKLRKVSCDICKSGEDEIIDFIVKWGFLSRNDDAQSMLKAGEKDMSVFIKPIMEQVMQSIPTINDPIKFADLGLKKRYYDESGKPLHVDSDCGHPVDATGLAYNAEREQLEKLIDDDTGNDTCTLVLPGTTSEQFAVEVAPAPTGLHLQQTLQVSSIKTVKDIFDEHLRYAAKINLTGGFVAKGQDAKNAGIGAHHQDASEDKDVKSISYDGSIDATLALSSSAINEYIFSQHQLGFLASEGLDFTMTTALLDVLGGQELGVNDFYSYLFKHSDLVDDSATDKSKSVANMDEIDVKLITHQAPYVNLTGETPGRQGIYANFFGFEFPDLGGKDLVPGSVKIMVPDLQVVVYNKGRNGLATPQKLLDFRINLELDTYISASGTTHLPQLTPKDIFSKVNVLSVDHFPYPDVSDVTQKAILSYAMVRTIDHALERPVDGGIDQLNVLLMGLMSQMSRLEDVDHATCTDSTNLSSCGELDLDFFPTALRYKTLLSNMKYSAILHKPVFRWLTVDKDSGWLTMGIDLQTSRLNVCPQFKSGLNGAVYSSGKLAAPNLDEGAPLSICIHSADVNY